MKRIFLLLLLLTCFYAKGQLINKAEYFIDTDPGNGNGVNVPVSTAGPSVNLNFDVPTIGLANGFHHLFIRTRSDDGMWSLAESRVFLVSVFEDLTSDIAAAEYFVDTDPGQGSGTALNIGTAGSTVTFSSAISSTGLSGGFHHLFVRIKNSIGVWSLVESKAFYLSILDAANNDIVAAEYFLDTDPGQGSGTAVKIDTAGASVSFLAAIPTTGLADGFHTLFFRAKNSQGIWGLSERRVFYLSNQVLPAADITAMEYFIDTDPGTGKGIAVTVTPGSTVTLLANIPTTGLTAGKHFLFLRAKSADGWGHNEQKEFTIGAAVAPAKPVIASIDNRPTSPALTNLNKPIIKGTAERNMTIEVFNATTSLGKVTVDTSGNWSFTPVTALPDGTSNITAKAKNASNLESLASDVFVVIIDTKAPAVATIVSIDGKTAQKFTTAQNKPVIVGLAEASATVEVFNGTVKLGESTADTAGNYSFIPVIALADGNYAIAVNAKDAAGNVGARSKTFSFTILTAMPTAPVIVSVDGKTTQNFVSSNNKPLVSGTATALIAVNIFNGANGLGNTKTNASGAFNFLPGTALADGTYTLTAKTNNSGNVSSEVSNSFSFTIDTKAPSTPVIVSIVNRTTPNFVTNINQPVITGTGEPGSNIEIFNGTISVGFALVGADGEFTFTPSNPLPDGKIVVTTKAKDAAGNTSLSSSTFGFTLDTQAPAAPVIVNVDSKTTQNFVTANNRPLIIGTAEPGSNLEIFNGSTLLGTVIVAADGSYIFTPSSALPDGSYVLTLKTKDAAGNVSATSANFNFSIDTTAPGVPVIVSVDAKTSQNFTTSNNRPVISGTAENLSSIELFNGTTSVAVINANAAGNFTFTPSSALPDGDYILTAKAKDAVGNLSVASASFSFRIDSSVPNAPLITSVDGKTNQNFRTANNHPIIIGSAEALATIELFNGTTSIGNLSANAAGSFSFTSTSPMPDGNYVLTAKAKDAVGNLSAASTSFSFVIDTEAPLNPVIVSIDRQTISPAVSTTNQPVLTGTAEEASLVTIFDGSNAIGKVTTNATGDWSFSSPALAIGIHDFTITAKDLTGNESTRSNVFVYDLIPITTEITANNVLTPNGDGKNDYLLVENLQYYPKSLIRIYDNAGRIVFTANAYKNDWSGDLNGTTLAEGTYYYAIELGDRFGVFKSFITVIRKTNR